MGEVAEDAEKCVIRDVRITAPQGEPATGATTNMRCS